MIRSEAASLIGLTEMPEPRGDLLRLERVQRRDDLLGGVRPGLVLDSGVQVLGVLADDDDVDVLVARAHARVRLAGAQACVQLELVAERDVDRAEARADRRRDRALEGDAVLATDSSVSSGSGVPASSMTSTPAWRTSHSRATPVASRTRRVASVSSGPVPSPGMRVTRWPIGAAMVADARPADRDSLARISIAGMP